MNTRKKGRSLARAKKLKVTASRVAEANSVVVIGLGRFGYSLAMELMANGTDVLGIDANPEIVQSLNGELTRVVCADSTKEEALRQLAVNEYDRVVVAIGSDIQASILTCSALLGMGLPSIWSKAVSDRHGQILQQLGVHHVVNPEKDMGRKVAHLVRGAAIDFVEIDKGYALVKIAVPAEILGKRLGDTDTRTRFGVTVAAVQHEDGVWESADAETTLSSTDTILILGPTSRAEDFAQIR